ncbi:zinc ribbon domain-containing protein [Streptomyces cavernicola]|uniref:Zinc ribbon domain-containing protein n=1 Tax=Streptomyces cavernicola TaxID=3043613 RepID=A0ABT6SGZ8_9ACTN|nr:zinc ribbon domain-containing protein [Streptomyces sp. B-S-A6]MDI3406942.1 zinc ribbon domain-containing protein [Streptomyces sp. B-S-A6]
MSEPTAPTVAYAEGLAAGELRFQHCTACERAVFHPRVLCPHCGDAEPGARVALVNGNGGVLSSQATALLGTAEALG